MTINPELQKAQQDIQRQESKFAEARTQVERLQPKIRQTKEELLKATPQSQARVRSAVVTRGQEKAGQLQQLQQQEQKFQEQVKPTKAVIEEAVAYENVMRHYNKGMLGALLFSGSLTGREARIAKEILKEESAQKKVNLQLESGTIPKELQTRIETLKARGLPEAKAFEIVGLQKVETTIPKLKTQEVYPEDARIKIARPLSKIDKAEQFVRERTTYPAGEYIFKKTGLTKELTGELVSSEKFWNPAKALGINLSLGFPKTKAMKEGERIIKKELTIGYLTGLKEQPIKTIVSTAAFFVLPGALKGASYIPGVTRVVASPLGKTIGIGVKYGLPALYGTSVYTRIKETPEGTQRVRKFGELLATEVTPMVVGGYTGSKFWPYASRVVTSTRIKKLTNLKPTKSFTLRTTKGKVAIDKGYFVKEKPYGTGETKILDITRIGNNKKFAGVGIKEETIIVKDWWSGKPVVLKGKDIYTYTGNLLKTNKGVTSSIFTTKEIKGINILGSGKELVKTTSSGKITAGGGGTYDIGRGYKVSQSGANPKLSYDPITTKSSLKFRKDYFSVIKVKDVSIQGEGGISFIPKGTGTTTTLQTTSVKQVPTIVPKPITNIPKVSSILKPTSSLNEITKGAGVLGLVQSGRTITDTLTKTTPTQDTLQQQDTSQRQDTQTKQIPVTTTFVSQVPVTAGRTTTITTQIPAATLATAQTLTSLTQISSILRTPTKPKIPPISPTITPPTTSQSLRVSKKVQPLSFATGYKTLVKRGGKFFELPGVRSRGEAIQLGSKRTMETLAATFKVEPVSTRIRKVNKLEFTPSPIEFRTYQIQKSKKVQLKDTWIQRRGKRLGRRSEVTELMSLKKMKGGKGKKIKIL